MQEDSEGFLYPKVDLSLCIDCHLCEKVCPELHQGELRYPKNSYAARNFDEDIVMKSSSGGLFTALSEIILSEGGIVFGAKFDENWKVKHDFTDNVDGLENFRGSKYLQSEIGNSYKRVEQFLKQGKQVMFTGTPCQIAGLKNYLRKDYSNLLTVDIVCHGVPSPSVWQAHLKTIIGHKFGQIFKINFRDKSLGWLNRNYSLSVEEKDRQPIYIKKAFKDKFMNCFLRNLSIRPACFTCSVKCGRSGSDILLGDLWGVETLFPEFNDEKGASVVLVYTTKGKKFINQLKTNIHVINYKNIVLNNPAIEHNPDVSPDQLNFWNAFCVEQEKAIKSYGKPLEASFKIRLKMILCKLLDKYFNH